MIFCNTCCNTLRFCNTCCNSLIFFDTHYITLILRINYVLGPAVKFPRKILNYFRKRRKTINWSMLRFFPFVGRKFSNMILSFIVSFSFRNKNTYVKRILILISSLKNIEVVSKKYVMSLHWVFLMNLFPPPPNYLVHSYFTLWTPH